MPIISSSDDREFYRAPLFPWLAPTRWAAAQAAKLQGAVRDSEGKWDFVPKSDDTVRQSVVNAREDLVMIYSMQVANHRQLVRISWAVWLIAFFAFVLANKS